MVALWVVHAFGVLPSKVTNETETRDENCHDPDCGKGVEMRDHLVVFEGESNAGGCVCVCGNEAEPDK